MGNENYIDCKLSMLVTICMYYCRENRYLLFLTENYSALNILQQTNFINHEPLVLFGSSFPQDINYTQVFKLLQLLTTV